MRRALQLASKGSGRTQTNPLVGCVVVHRNHIIGEGYHQRYGEAHAEVNAIESVKAHDRYKLPESTVYVTLEPCSHYGKTPPCADLLIANRIKRVVIASVDPFIEVQGRGIQKMQDAGIEVVTGILLEESAYINRRFFCNQTKQRPYVILKWAECNNGYIAEDSGKPTVISSPLASLLLHKWRSEECAFMIGKNTWLADNPQLTNRYWPGKNPLRIVTAPLNKHSVSSRFCESDSPCLWISEQHELGSDIKPGVSVLTHNPRDLKNVLSILYSEYKVGSLVVEGGARLLQSFIDTNLCDEVRVFVSQKRALSGGVKAPQWDRVGARKVQSTSIGTDVLTRALF